jgi:hypothetical protein
MNTMTAKPKISQSEDNTPKCPPTEALPAKDDSIDKPITSPVVSPEKDLMQEGYFII